MSTNCSECGAHLNEGASVCDLCGSPVPGFLPSRPTEDPQNGLDAEASSVATRGEDESASTTESDAETEPADSPAGQIFCNQCGWQNPVGSNFCSSCGTKLQKLTQAPDQSAPVRPSSGPGPKKPPTGSTRKQRGGKKSTAPSKSDAPSSVGRQMGIIIGAGVLIVIALYMMSVMGGSETPSQGGQTAAFIPQEGPLREPFASQAQALRKEVLLLTGDDRIDKQRGLINIYISATRLDLAGTEAEQVAQQVNTERAWIDAGNLYYDWMDMRPSGQKGAWSEKAVDAYRKALDINPENLDVRTDMSIALMFHPRESAMASQENLNVLERDSTHVQANFNRGIMLLQINRIDQARMQFEKVMSLVNDPADPIYQNAQDAITRIASQNPGL